MLFLIPLALIGWIPVCVVLFAVMPARRAVVTAIIAAWTFLPPGTIPLPGFPDYNKAMAAVVGIMLGTLIFEPNRVIDFRPRWFDLPMLCWCLCPMASSLSNGLGVYDGLSASLTNIVAWGLPYLIGRLYFSDGEGLRELAAGIVIGGLVYVPFCLVEMRMSPLFLSKIYGVNSFEGLRLGGWRPHVFFKTGLECGLWMTAAALAGVWLWASGTLKKIGPYPFGGVLLPVLVVTTILCRSTGALALLMMGLGSLWASVRFNSKAFMYMLLAVAPAYYAIRIPNYWTGESLVKAIETYVDEDRAQSFEFRLENENLLIEKAMKQRGFGWGGWGRSRVYDEEGKDIAITDGLWVITLGVNGLVGLGALTASLLLPPVLFTLRIPVRRWRDPAVGPLAVAAVLAALYLIDCLLNGFINLIYLTAAGGLAGAVPLFARWKDSPRHAEEETARLNASALARDHQDEPDLGPAAADPLPQAAATQARLAGRYKDLGRTFKDQGRADHAKESWMHALDLLARLSSAHPDRPEFQRQWCDCANDLAWLLLAHPDSAVGDPAQAVELATRTTELAPRCAAYWNTLGAAFYRAGDSDGTLNALDRSVFLSEGGNGFDYLFLAMAHARLGHSDQASSWYVRASHWIEEHHPHHLELRQLLNEARELLASPHSHSTTPSR